MTNVAIHRPDPVKMPRFAPVAAQWFAKLLELMHLARRVHSARRERAQRIAEAAQVRRLAWSVRDTDPGLASDLLAAADRHEW